MRQNLVLGFGAVRATKGEGAQESGDENEPLPGGVRSDLQADTAVIYIVSQIC